MSQMDAARLYGLFIFFFLLLMLLLLFLYSQYQGVEPRKSIRITWALFLFYFAASYIAYFFIFCCTLCCYSQQQIPDNRGTRLNAPKQQLCLIILRYAHEDNEDDIDKEGINVFYKWVWCFLFFSTAAANAVQNVAIGILEFIRYNPKRGASTNACIGK